MGYVTTPSQPSILGWVGVLVCTQIEQPGSWGPFPSQLLGGAGFGYCKWAGLGGGVGGGAVPQWGTMEGLHSAGVKKKASSWPWRGGRLESLPHIPLHPPQCWGWRIWNGGLSGGEELAPPLHSAPSLNLLGVSGLESWISPPCQTLGIQSLVLDGDINVFTWVRSWKAPEFNGGPLLFCLLSKCVYPS